MLKMKFVLLLMLLFFIVDSKKLRNKLKTKTRCNKRGAKCGTFRNPCCRGLRCIVEKDYIIAMVGKCGS